MKEHTPEVINLCKQVAEKHRKKIGKGDWIYWLNVRTIELLSEDVYVPEHIHSWFPLWTLSDGLEFLKEKDWIITLADSNTPKYGEYYFSYFMSHDRPNRKPGSYKYGNTALEACLKAVLAVLDEGK